MHATFGNARATCITHACGKPAGPIGITACLDAILLGVEAAAATSAATLHEPHTLVLTWVAAHLKNKPQGTIRKE